MNLPQNFLFHFHPNIVGKIRQVTGWIAYFLIVEKLQSIRNVHIGHDNVSQGHGDCDLEIETSYQYLKALVDQFMSLLPS